VETRTKGVKGFSTRFQEIGNSPDAIVAAVLAKEYMTRFVAPIGRYLDARQALRIVVALTPDVFPIFGQESSCVRSSRARSRWNSARGPSLRVPYCFARINPARTRAEIRTRSCLARLANKLMMTSRNGPALSIHGSVRLRHRTP
jgi:hypothetical protein